MPPSRLLARRTTRSRRRSLGPQSLLILQLDAAQLQTDGLHLGGVAAYSAILSAYALGARVEVRDATTTASLLSLFAEFATQKRTFDVIVIVAHSNASGIQIASDRFADWTAFAAWLKPLRPRRLLLAACRAGRWDAGQALFAANKQLTRIFACPVNASLEFAKIMLLAIPYVVAERRVRDTHVFRAHVIAIGATGRQLREWRKTADKGNPDSLVFDFVADALDPLARRVPAALEAILNSLIGR